jgi:glutamyl/glutaminyl-tRNA synthetase
MSAYRKTRIAPTPSGYLHLGNVLSFAITAAIAQQTGAKILLRIDDLDRERIRKEYVQDIFDTLQFLEIPWHEGPKDYTAYEHEYSQVHRLPLYQAALQQLRDNGQVFACNCSRTQILHAPEGVYHGPCRHEQIPLDAAEVSWRLYTTADAALEVHTQEGVIPATLPHLMQDLVVRKKDGYPAYQLASLIDDIHFNVDLIVRGADLWNSTLAQLHLADVLEQHAFKATVFHHHALLLNRDGLKLSKSAGATAVSTLRKEGKTRADIYARIGEWLGLTGPVRSLDELVAGMQGAVV